MNNIALVLMREVGMMAMIISLGILLKKKGMFTESTARSLSNFLLIIVLPVLLINTFQQKKEPELMRGFWLILIVFSAMLAVSAVIATICFRSSKDGTKRYRIDRIAAVLPNCGFMGIPLMLATVGEEYLIYCAAPIGAFQVMVWVWAVPMVEGRKPSLRQIFINPGVCAFLLGLSLFLLEIPVPALISSFTAQISSVNTPVSMLMIGMFLADVSIKDTFLTPSIYKAVFLRSLVVPMLTVLVVYALGITAVYGMPVSLTLIVMISCSCATSVLLIPLRIGENSSYASRMIAVSTLCSLFTMPLMADIAEKIL